MKRYALIMLAALLLAVPASAQYTQYFSGDQVTIEQMEVASVLTNIHNVPWSIPDLNDNYVWHGYLEATPDQLVLSFDSIHVVSYITGESRFLTIAPREWRNGKAFSWSDDLNCYVRLYPDPDSQMVVFFELVTVDASAGVAHLYDGALHFTGSPPVWWDIDPGHWMFQWQINAFTYEMLGGPINEQRYESE